MIILCGIAHLMTGKVLLIPGLLSSGRAKPERFKGRADQIVSKSMDSKETNWSLILTMNPNVNKKSAPIMCEVAYARRKIQLHSKIPSLVFNAILMFRFLYTGIGVPFAAFRLKSRKEILLEGEAGKMEMEAPVSMRNFE